MSRATTPSPSDHAASTGHALATTPQSADSPHWDEALRDGTRVLVRPIRREDAALEREFIEHLSATSRRLRFLGSIGEPSDELIRSLTDIDYRRDVAFVAVIERDGVPCEIGVSRFSLAADGQSCECAVTVADEWQNQGLGSLLMRHLIGIARQRGVRTMVSFDAADNAAMRDLAQYLGFRRERDPDDATQVIHTLVL
ncbi:MAG TPA: GNAT family N-acetyltransferase [Dokdonella sp.]